MEMLLVDCSLEQLQEQLVDCQVNMADPLIIDDENLTQERMEYIQKLIDTYELF